jgi:hypothetical protein
MNVSLNSYFQVTDVFDTAPEFTKPLYAAGINTGDKVNDIVTIFSVSMKPQLKFSSEKLQRNCRSGPHRYRSVFYTEATCGHELGLLPIFVSPD